MIFYVLFAGKAKLRNAMKEKKNQEPAKVKSFKGNIPLIFLFIFSIALYINTIGHQYALDDSIVIVKNQFTKKGISGIPDILSNDSFTGFFGVQKNLVSGGRYRPMSIVSFAMEYQCFGLNPAISHLINILLYALLVLLVYVLISKLLVTNKNQKWWLSLAFLTALLFAVHPLHTEVVANIKGRDEIFALLGSLLSFIWAILYVEKNKVKYLLFSSLALFFGLLSKENAIAFVAIIPLGIWFFKCSEIKKIGLVTAPLFLVSILFVAIRAKILGPIGIEPASEWMNNPFLNAGFNEKYATIFYTFLLYFKLLFIPFPLTYDYYPNHIEIIGWNFWGSITGLLLTIGIIFWFILSFKKKNIAVFAIFIFVSSFILASNLIFPVGVFMAERFLFMPSFGFSLLISWYLIIWLKKTNSKTMLYGFSGILVVYSFLTIQRNKAWESDYILFTTDVKTSKNSAKANCTAGGKIWEEAKQKQDIAERNTMFQQSLKYLNKAVEIYPNYNDALLLRGNVMWDFKKNYTSSIDNYFHILSRNPYHSDAFNNSVMVLNMSDDEEFKLQAWLKLQSFQPLRWEPFYQAGIIYGRIKNDMNNASIMFEKAITLNGEKKEIYKDLGVVYGFKKEYNKAAQTLEKALQLDPDDAQTCYNLGITYMALNDKQKADIYFKMAEEKKKKKD